MCSIFSIILHNCKRTLSMIAPDYLKNLRNIPDAGIRRWHNKKFASGCTFKFVRIRIWSAFIFFSRSSGIDGTASECIGRHWLHSNWFCCRREAHSRTCRSSCHPEPVIESASMRCASDGVTFAMALAIMSVRIRHWFGFVVLHVIALWLFDWIVFHQHCLDSHRVESKRTNGNMNLDWHWIQNSIQLNSNRTYTTARG